MSSSYLAALKKAQQDKNQEQIAFLNKVGSTTSRKVGEMSECWLWSGTLDKKTLYGSYQTKNMLNRGISYAHQASYWLFKDQAFRPNRKFPVSHLCESKENGSHRHCVNPEHLQIKTLQENIADRDRNLGNYQPSGADNNNALFSLTQAQEIWNKHVEGKEYQELAEEYNCNRRTIERICIGETYDLGDSRVVIEERRQAKIKRIQEAVANGEKPSHIAKRENCSRSYITLCKNLSQA